MALHDLVWCVDSVRSVRSSDAAEPSIAEVHNLIDTSDIHLFLSQEP
jgi:hypothetical protein